MQIPFTIMGFDFIAEVDWTLTYRGSPGRLYGPPENCYPPEDPEWTINSITLYNEDSSLGQGFDATGELFFALADSRKIDEAILDYIYENGEDEDVYPDEDYYRDR